MLIYTLFLSYIYLFVCLFFIQKIPFYLSLGMRNQEIISVIAVGSLPSREKIVSGKVIKLSRNVKLRK